MIEDESCALLSKRRSNKLRSGLALQDVRERFGDMVAFQTFYRSQLCDDFLCSVRHIGNSQSRANLIAVTQALDYFAALLKTMERKDNRERDDDESFVVTTGGERRSVVAMSTT